ncbi:hypothetical protein D3C73_475640 [compost metagenome]
MQLGDAQRAAVAVQVGCQQLDLFGQRQLHGCLGQLDAALLAHRQQLAQIPLQAAQQAWKSAQVPSGVNQLVLPFRLRGGVMHLDQLSQGSPSAMAGADRAAAAEHPWLSFRSESQERAGEELVADIDQDDG